LTTPIQRLIFYLLTVTNIIVLIVLLLHLTFYIYFVLIENIATPEQRAKGLDIADYMIEELKNKTNQSQIYSCFSTDLQSMVKINPLLNILINELDLIEVLSCK